MATIAELDLLDPASFASGPPHDYFDHLRGYDPCHELRAPYGDRFWALTRAADIRAVSMDTERFTSSLGFLYPAALASSIRAAGQDNEHFRGQLINNLMWHDGSHHARLRGFLASAFSPRVVARFEHWIREICVRIVREVQEKQTFDAIPQIAAELPAQVVASILGVPEEDRHLIVSWANDMFGRMDPEIGFEKGAKAHQGVIDYLHKLREIKLAHPAADMATELLSAHYQGDPIALAEYVESGLMILIAGFETTHTLIAQSLLLMATDEDARQQVETGPLKIVVEELLRIVSPVMHMGRTARQDVELHGKTIREGEFVMLWFTAGNRDPELYENPHKFDISRRRAGHSAFGAGGPHYCIGSHLAKLEVEILFEEFRKAGLRLDLNGEWKHAVTVSINAISRLPMKVV